MKIDKTTKILLYVSGGLIAFGIACAYPSIIGVVILLAVYFLPSIIGWEKANSGAIFLLNLLLGWTVVGWIVALVWASTVEKEPVRIFTQKVNEYTCKNCQYCSNENNYYCPRCLTDSEGFTAEANKLRFAKWSTALNTDSAITTWATF